MLNKTKANRFLKLINLAFCLGLFSVTLVGQAWAKESKQEKTKTDNENAGLPIRRVGGGTRDGCTANTVVGLQNMECEPLIALIPEDLVITSKTVPTMLFSVPAIDKPQNVQLEFVLRDDKDQLVYQTTFTTTGQSGIIKFQLPTSETFKGLKAQTNYHWYVSIVYRPGDRSHDDVVEGWIRHTPINPSLTAQLNQATPIEQVKLYQENRLWSEAINTLAQLKQANPNDPTISKMWNELLKSVDLDMIAQKPLINSPSVSQSPVTRQFSLIRVSPL